VAQAVAKLSRLDVAEAMEGEEQCGFVIDVPRSVLTSNKSSVVRLFIMPEQRELTGSPCILAPEFMSAHA
jgi:hypothetical protein